MRNEKEYRERCAARGLDAAAVDSAVGTVRAMESWARERGEEEDRVPLHLVEGFVAKLLAEGRAGEENLMALARYFAVIGEEEKSIRLLAYLLPIGVMEAMADRLARLEGEGVREKLKVCVSIPPAGSPPEAYPRAAKAFVAALESELGEERARNVLMWNVHGIPASAYAEERERFLAAPSIDTWIADYHERQVAVLARHAADGTLWFEQKITNRVVDYVRSNPEICGARREGRKLFTTKIPYNPDAWLASTDPLERRHLACHCPFAASAIGKEDAGPSALWCSCSAGFDKFMFDIVFGEETECEVLESVLAGNERCRFAIKIPEPVPLFREIGDGT